jgi:DNA-binding beta-propeller fold protein YncE
MALKSIALTLAAVLTLPSVPAAAEIYNYQSAFGTLGNGDQQFDGPVALSVDVAGHRLLVADETNSRVLILNSDTFAYVATIGTDEVVGSDNSHFYFPNGVAFDPATNRIFVADSGNDRVQVFDGSSYVYQTTLGTTEVADPDNSHFSFPLGVTVAAGRLFVADFNEDRIQVFDAASLAYIATIGTSGIQGSDEAHFLGPTDVKVNPVTGQIWVTDEGNSRVQIFDASTYAYASTLSSVSSYGLGFDQATGTALVAATNANQVIVYNAATAQQLEILGAAGGGPGQFNSPGPVVIADGRIIAADTNNNRLEIFTPGASPIVSSILPGSRAVEVGHTATVFATMINTGSSPLQACQPGLSSGLIDAGMAFSYQTTNPSTNALIGTADTPATVPAGGVQSFVLSFTDGSPVTLSAQPVNFSCSGVAPASPVKGVNTVDLVVSSSPIADVIALSATTTGDGTAHLVSNSGFFALASDNVGATAQLTVAPDFGGAALPLTATICETNPSTGVCLSPAAPSVSASIAGGATPTFTVFLTATAAIPFSPATSRVFVRFTDAQGQSHGSTSVAVTTN